MKPFQLYDENTQVTYYLTILETPEFETEDGMGDFFDRYMCDTEKMWFLESTFGVHDVAYDDDVLFGFTSYEWKPAMIPLLKAEWSNWLTDLGFKVGEWYE